MPSAKLPLRKPPAARSLGRAAGADRPDPASPPPLPERLERAPARPGQGNATVVYDTNKNRARSGNPLGRDTPRQTLRHGDECATGDTVVQLVEPGAEVVRGAKPGLLEPTRTGFEVNASRRAPYSSLERRAPFYVAILGALLIAFGLGMVRRPKPARERPDAAQVDGRGSLAQQRFQEGVALLEQGKWLEARDKLEIAAGLDESDAAIARLLEAARAEAPRAQLLAVARTALLRKDFAAVGAALQRIPENSALADDARDLEQQLRTALDDAVREAKLRAESGDAAGASGLLAPVLAADPSRADALAVKRVIDPQRRAGAADRPRRRRAEKPATQGQGPVQGPSEKAPPALDAYLSGDIGVALERARLDPAARGLLGQLQLFDSGYRDGLAKVTARRIPEALKAFEIAARADAVIAAGKQGRLGQQVRKSLSTLHYQLGIATAQTDEGLPQAASHLRAAVAADAGNDPAQQQLAQVIERARDLYMRGYVAKDSDAEAARRSFEVVVATLPAADETAQKAKRWLDRLNGREPGEDG